MFRSMLRSTLALLCLVSFAPTPAKALDIAGIELLWLQDIVGGVGPTVYGLEAIVILDDTSGFTSIQMTGPAPVGTQTLTQVDPIEWEVSNFYGSSAALFGDYPQTGTYRFEFLNGAAVIDSYDIVLAPGDINEVTEFVLASSPVHNSTLPANGSFVWDCGTCDGTSVALDVVDLGTDVEIDRFTGPPAAGSWSPTGLVPGRNYESEMILADYFDNDPALETTTSGDTFQALVGYESINLVEFTATAPIPEPGTAALLGGGLLVLAAGRRTRAARA